MWHITSLEYVSAFSRSRLTGHGPTYTRGIFHRGSNQGPYQENLLRSHARFVSASPFRQTPPAPLAHVDLDILWGVIMVV